MRFLKITDRLGRTLQVLTLLTHLRLKRSSTIGPRKIVAVIMIGQATSLIFNLRNLNDNNKSIQDLLE